MKTFTYGQRLLTVDKVNLQYGDKVVLRDINLAIDDINRPGLTQGQCVALLGPSGIGKTQLFRIIAGLQNPTSGAVTAIDHRTPIKAGTVGVVQQTYPLLAHRTVMGNLRLVSKDQTRIDELLTKFNLAEHVAKYPVQLSGGQRQRIAIIQQLLCSNHFLLMDEPFSGLDIIAKDKVINVMNEVNSHDELNTTIFTTHDIEAAVTIADHVWILGREEGKPGATVVATYDLIQRDLAWGQNVTAHPNFQPTVNEIKALFKKL